MNTEKREKELIKEDKMKEETYGTCPRCEREMTTFPALSRRDNKTDICSDCGQAEALEDYYRERWTDKVYWEVKWK